MKRKHQPLHASFVFSNGNSNLEPYKRRREVYEGLTFSEVHEFAKALHMVVRITCKGGFSLFTEKGVDLNDSRAYLKPYISFSGKDYEDGSPSVMEVWGAPVPCSELEAERYYLSKALEPCEVA